MIKFRSGRLKAPSSIQVGDVRFRLSVGDNIHQQYAKLNDEEGDRILDSVVYRSGFDLWTVIISADECQHGILIHASIASKNQDPSWDMIKGLKEAVFGDTDAMMVLPKKSHYVNMHSHCFHLWAMPKEWGIR